MACSRCIFPSNRWERLQNLPQTPLFDRARHSLLTLAEQWAENRTIAVNETGHNWHLIRARNAQTRVVTLLVAWGMTGDRRFREQALAYLHDMASWEYWSWITWRKHDPRPEAIFDLSYGENALTFAYAWECLADDATTEERDFLLRTAQQRLVSPYLAQNGSPGKEMWYFRKGDTNWNAVCNGGIGLLALVMPLPHRETLLARAEESLRPYFESMEEDGAWPEGIGYWNYGHRYGYTYLLSRERAEGSPHPLLERPGSRNTLRFPLLFSPNGVPASFGDVNHFSPLPFHLAAAERYGLADVLEELNRRFEPILNHDPARLNQHGPWPGLAEWLLFQPDSLPHSEACKWPRVHVAKGLEWACLADQWPQPHLYASVRGGTTRAPHTHQDLTALNIVCGDEVLVGGVSGPYLDTTFGPRRLELYEISGASKSLLLVNGVALPYPDSRVQTQSISGPGWEGVRMDAHEAASTGSPVSLYFRAVLLLGSSALLVLDGLRCEFPAQVEARFHVRGTLRTWKTGAILRGQKHQLVVRFACNQPASLRKAMGCPTLPDAPPDPILRWMSKGRITTITMAALFAGKGPLQIRFSTPNVLVARGPNFSARFQCPTCPNDALTGACNPSS